MATFDITSYKIRVILDPKKIRTPSCNKPIDVEGTIYGIQTLNYTTSKLAEQRQISELLNSNNTIALVRWDNDYKSAIPISSLIIRSSEINYCRSIWDNEKPTIKSDTRPYEELMPTTTSLLNVKNQTNKYEKLMLNDIAKKYNLEKKENKQYINVVGASTSKTKKRHKSKWDKFNTFDQEPANEAFIKIANKYTDYEKFAVYNHSLINMEDTSSVDVPEDVENPCCSTHPVEEIRGEIEGSFKPTQPSEKDSITTVVHTNASINNY